MKPNPLQKLEALGQSIWMDYIRRGTLESGELRRLIEEDGLSGVTSNPSIFEKAIAGSHDYDIAIRALALENRSIDEIYQAITVEDIQQAADLFRPLYERLDGADGFVSLEVSPLLAHDTERTIAEAQKLWSSVDRPNVMIKVPATKEGLPAIRRLIAQGINVNITLLFGLPRYREVAEAYISGLEDRVEKGLPVANIASVASFFLSRIDVMVDPMLGSEMQVDDPDVEIASSLLGRTAIASAKIAYAMYKEILHSDRFKKLAALGSRPQRLLWASTSTKNPAYSDIRYVESLIGPETINTLPGETLNAYRDHGNPRLTLSKDIGVARSRLKGLEQLSFNLDAITQKLEDKGVEKFVKAFDVLMNTLRQKRSDALGEPLDRQSIQIQSSDSTALETLEQQKTPTRLWQKDPTLWKSDTKSRTSIRNSLGWLHVAEKMEANIRVINDFVALVKGNGFRRVVHMGMGGSSLAPLVFQRIFTASGTSLPLIVLDTTDPITINKIEEEGSLGETLFIVASKSGTTAEPLAFLNYFYKKVRDIKGGEAAKNFVAITDPGTPLEKLARRRKFLRTFLNFPDIGGRYSALSYFGLVPAALHGVDVDELLIRALRMTHACGSCIPVRENPGIALGATLGTLARKGRNKLTFLLPESLSAFGLWLEQLLAESTGKESTGILPVTGEPMGSPNEYGDDRVFVYLRLKDEIDETLEKGVMALQETGNPVIRMTMDDRMDLGQEFFRWEIATAIAGSILKINPFNQPNVQESKDNTDRLLAKLGKHGKLPVEKDAITEGPLTLFPEKPSKSIGWALEHLFAKSKKGAYVALLAYLPEDTDTDRRLQSIRCRIRSRYHLATTLGYGPRYLHSTGQFHKGGLKNGLFLVLTTDNALDLPIPNRPYSFGLFKKAQALGDLQALRNHDRQVLHIHLASDMRLSLNALERLLCEATAEGES